jgi:hypothetical protein
VRRPGRNWEKNMHVQSTKYTIIKKVGISEDDQQTMAQYKSKKARKSTVRNECIGNKSKEYGWNERRK